MVTGSIDLKHSKVLPAFMMAVFSVYISVDFNSVGMQSLSYLTLACTLVSFGIGLYLIFRKGTTCGFDLLVLALTVEVLALSLVNGLYWKNWMYVSCSMLLLVSAFNYYQDDCRPLLIGALIGFSISVYVGAFQIFTHPDMWLFEDAKENRGYLLGGNYNGAGCRVIAALLTNIMCLRISKKFWLNLIPLGVVSIAMLSLVKSMTSLSCVCLFLFLCIIPNRKLQRIAVWSLLAVAILFEIFVCCRGKGLENSEIATWFIVDVLGKDITFTHRTDMWDSALRMISNSPIWGYGYPDIDWYYANLSSFAIGPHNMIFGVLINGGIIALGIYLALYWKSLSQLSKFPGRTSNVVFAAIAVLTVMMLMEVYPFPFITLFLIYARYIDKIEESIKPARLR